MFNFFLATFESGVYQGMYAQQCVDHKKKSLLNVQDILGVFDDRTTKIQLGDKTRFCCVFTSCRFSTDKTVGKRCLIITLNKMACSTKQLVINTMFYIYL